MVPIQKGDGEMKSFEIRHGREENSYRILYLNHICTEITREDLKCYMEAHGLSYNDKEYNLQRFDRKPVSPQEHANPCGEVAMGNPTPYHRYCFQTGYEPFEAELVIDWLDTNEALDTAAPSTKEEFADCLYKARVANRAKELEDHCLPLGLTNHLVTVSGCDSANGVKMSRWLRGDGAHYPIPDDEESYDDARKAMNAFYPSPSPSRDEIAEAIESVWCIDPATYKFGECDAKGCAEDRRSEKQRFCSDVCWKADRTVRPRPEEVFDSYTLVGSGQIMRQATDNCCGMRESRLQDLPDDYHPTRLSVTYSEED